MSASIEGARCLARLWQGANQCLWEPRYPLSPETPFTATLNSTTQSYVLLSGTDPLTHRENVGRRLCSSHSHLLISDRSGMIYPSLKNRDSPLNREPTLPSGRSPNVMGPTGKVVSALNFDLYKNFSQGARPLARPRLGANAHIQKLHYLVSSGTPLRTTFDDRRCSYG